ncbi:tetratricopeptide repeat protein [Thalassospiraceae bacterium LMO-JJ14]|nr:tetratricopeptide repeat protein [Thalassospiraceae bacterium LMO-JJ14]
MADAEKTLEQAGADFASGNFAEAARNFRAVIRMHPEVGELYINLGAALRASGDIASAEKAYREAISKLPKSPLAWFNLANLLREMNRGPEALAAYRKADSLQPATAEILNNLGVQLYDMGAIEDALKQYDAALAVRPGYGDALTNRGNALQRLGRTDEAETAIEQALTLAPANPVFLLNKSSLLAACGRHADAIVWADKAIAADPGYTEARLKRAGLLIQTGELEAGFREYEARFQIPNWHRLPAMMPMPAWRGEDIAGKSLLLWNEQGFGDALMYARYIPILLAMGVRVSVMVESALKELFKVSFNDVAVFDLKAPPGKADLHASLMSLPHLMRTTMQTIPADVPYLAPAAEDVRIWHDDVIALCKGKPAVGLIWAGNPGQSHDYTRSMASDRVQSLLAREDICLFNLLIGPRGDEIRDARLIDVRDRLDDFAATAALMQTLDLVISVDSAPAHLAGALAKPLWMALSYDPDIRYFLGTDETPWYPSATLYRQTAPGDWDGVMTRINADLNVFVRTKAKS